MVPKIGLLTTFTRATLTRSSAYPLCKILRAPMPVVSKLHARSVASATPTPRSAIPELDLTGKNVLVTGAARGLGLCMAQALLESGACVYALDRLREDERSPAFKAIEDRAASEWGTRLQYRQIDMREVDKLNDTVKSIANEAGSIDGLIAAAGIQQETKAIDYTAEDANRMFQVNITGTFMAAQAVARQYLRLKEADPEKHKSCSMAFIASMSGTVANRGLNCAAYNSSKSGVLQLARNLAAEWGQHNIRVNTISPGYIVTAMVEELFRTHPERRVEWGNHNMLGRVSSPEEYRSLAVFLMGDGSSFMTGSDLRCDGGHCAW